MKFLVSMFMPLAAVALIPFSAQSASAAHAANTCPPKDAFVCKFTVGANKGKQVVAFLHPKKHEVKNGAVYGMMGRMDIGAAIDSVGSEDSMVIYETEGHEFKRTLRFAHVPQIDEKTDLKAQLKKSKRGTLVVLPNSGQGTYSYDGSAPEFMLCEAKYFSQLNPHNPEEKQTDADACQAILDANAYTEKRRATQETPNKSAPAAAPKAKTTR